MAEKIQKEIARAGLCSRRKAEGLIALGKVKVNGRTAHIGQRVSETDEITVEGKKLQREKLEYYILNKPAGTTSTREDKHADKTVVELIPTKARIFPVGRLDVETTGLLILTNDGELAQKIIHPSASIGKKYLAKVSGATAQAVETLEKMKKIAGEKISQPTVKRINEGMLEITVHEGINRQVRRMCAQAGMRVLSLHRIGIGGLGLEGLNIGRHRKTTREELEKKIGLASNAESVRTG